MAGITKLFTQTASVRTYTGQNADGPLYADAVSVKVFVNDSRQLVRDATGTEIVSETTLYGHLVDIDTFLPQSLVTVNGREAEVVMAYRRDSAGPASAYHCQIVLK